MVAPNTQVYVPKNRAGFEGLFIVENKKSPAKKGATEPQFTKKKKNRKERTRRAVKNFVTPPECIPEHKDIQVRRTVVGHTLCKVTVRTAPRSEPKEAAKKTLNAAAVEFIPGAPVHTARKVQYSIQDMLAMRASPKCEEMTGAVRHTVATYASPKILAPAEPSKVNTYSLDAMKTISKSPMVKLQAPSVRRQLSFVLNEALLAPLVESSEEDDPSINVIPHLSCFNRPVTNSFIARPHRPDYYRALCSMRKAGPSRLPIDPMANRVVDPECQEIKFGKFKLGQRLEAYPGTPAKRVIQ